MRRIAAILALFFFVLATPAFAGPPATSKAKVSKSHRRRGVKREELGLAATMLFFPFLLPLPVKSAKIARVDVNNPSHKAVDKGSAIQGKPVTVH